MKEASRSVKGRRRPAQARSLQTYERIVEAAAEEFAAGGYDAATTTAIASRAGVAVGSVYQFFADKEDLLTALATRYAEGIEAIVAGSAGAVPSGSLVDIVGSIVDSVVAYARREPFFAVLLSGAGSPPVRKASERLRAQLAPPVQAVIAHKAISPRRRRHVANTAVDILAAVLPGTLDAEPRDRRAAVGELQLALVAYLRAVGDTPR